MSFALPGSRECQLPQTNYSFDALAKEIYEWARSKGFYDREMIPYEGWDNRGQVRNPSMPAEKLCLIHSEVSEVLEALRDEDRENEAEELADVVIRILDYAGWRGISLDKEIAKKMEKNRQRPHLHGRKF